MSIFVLCAFCPSLLVGCGTVAMVVVPPIVAGGAPHLIGAAVDAAGKAPTDGGPSPQDPAVAGVLDGGPIGYPVTAVYPTLARVVETSGFRLVASDDASLVIRFSYPFSPTLNQQGGEIDVSCVADGDGTRVRFKDDGRDTPSKVREIEARLLDGTLKWLRQPGLNTRTE